MSEQRQLVDRLVDGELNRTAERELLLDCEASDQWRELALAFVESRAFRQEMNSLMKESTTCDVVGQNQLALGSHRDGTRTIATPGTSAPPAPATNIVGSTTAETSRTDSYVWSMAAAVLLSLGIGYGLGWGWQRPNSTLPDFAVNQTVGHPDTTSDLPASMQFTFNHPATHEWQQIKIPVLRATDLGPDWRRRLQTNSSDQLVREMQQRGLNLRQERTLTPVRLESGQRVVVPVDYFFEQPYQ